MRFRCTAARALAPIVMSVLGLGTLASGVAAAASMPAGGAATGLGGTAPTPAPAPVLWVSLVAAGALAAIAGGYRIRRMRSIARHAR